MIATAFKPYGPAGHLGRVARVASQIVAKADTRLLELQCSVLTLYWGLTTFQVSSPIRVEVALPAIVLGMWSLIAILDHRRRLRRWSAFVRFFYWLSLGVLAFTAVRALGILLPLVVVHAVSSGLVYVRLGMAEAQREPG